MPARAVRTLVLLTALVAQTASARLNIGDRLPARPDPSNGSTPVSPGGGACFRSGGATTPLSLNGKPCTQNSQCGSGAICASPGAGKPKVCLLI